MRQINLAGLQGDNQLFEGFAFGVELSGVAGAGGGVADGEQAVDSVFPGLRKGFPNL